MAADHRTRDEMIPGMSAGSWRKARLAEIPALGEAADQSWWAEWARDPGYGVNWRSVGEHLGIQGFGVNAYEAGAGEELVVPHDERDYGNQEEIYLVVRGRARFVCAGEEVEVGELELLYVPAEVEREARALETPTIVFMVGGTPGKPYRHWTES
jgi:mannose-6-phosphate isomerase-like protein (cupin superfamily)